MSTDSLALRWGRLARWSDLTWVLARKNFRQRYLRSRLGVLWALLQPIAQATVLTIVFLKIFKVHRVPHYPVYVLSGIMTWGFFQQAAIGGTTSVVDNASLVKKVAVPKVTFPVSVVGGVLMVYALQMVVLIGGAASIGTLGASTPGLLLLATLLEAVLGVAVALLFCSVHVAFRDVRFLVESGLVMLFYLTPILWDPSRIPAAYRSYAQWNPMNGVLSLVRGALLERTVDWTAVGISAAMAALVLAVALPLFHRRSSVFADQV
ncbi:MAG TPA: ABC transporter permease [Mycobacteriales bacterium]|nr:ABC transporter permease [Mycobacteriales bacterium]